jgi:hypothetical protein
MVQSNHATRGIATSYPQGESVPNIVLVGVPHVAALNRVRAKLECAQIPHYCWTEPDNDMGFTAIATSALDNEQRQALRNYRLWTYARGAEQSACGFTADTRTNTPVAQPESVGL